MAWDLKNGRILIMTAVQAEKDAVLRGLGANDTFDVELAGVGPALAAARTAKALGENNYAIVISAGIAGGFVGKAEVGTIVIATEIVAADLGAETEHGFLGLDELGFGLMRISTESRLVIKLADTLGAAGLSVTSGPILTVSTVTGTAATALARANQIAGAAAEGMEGFGVAAAAQDCGLPVLEIRAISNPVGPRNREAWRIKEALAALEAACVILREEFTL